ncbi:hypothetical protein EYF80_062440 [Liparis tanakae]|uniref:Uncharacterized protein n=1 Tax=Liparis tanakae TaxID=230148 RepID=A0A4Z2EFD5_9TELE|nr:hypothetical protein EYF80_062440 [Liparis tanakae]
MLLPGRLRGFVFFSDARKSNTTRPQAATLVWDLGTHNAASEALSIMALQSAQTTSLTFDLPHREHPDCGSRIALWIPLDRCHWFLTQNRRVPQLSCSTECGHKVAAVVIRTDADSMASSSGSPLPDTEAIGTDLGI